MSHRFNRSLFTVLALVIVATTLFACGGTPAQPTAAPAAAQPTAAPAAAQPTAAPAAAAGKVAVGVVLPTKDEPLIESQAEQRVGRRA